MESTRREAVGPRDRSSLAARLDRAGYAACGADHRVEAGYLAEHGVAVAAHHQEDVDPTAGSHPEGPLEGVSPIGRCRLEAEALLAIGPDGLVDERRPALAEARLDPVRADRASPASSSAAWSSLHLRATPHPNLHSYHLA